MGANVPPNRPAAFAIPTPILLTGVGYNSEAWIKTILKVPAIPNFPIIENTVAKIANVSLSKGISQWL